MGARGRGQEHLVSKDGVASTGAVLAIIDRLPIRGDRAAEEHAVGVGQADKDSQRVAHTVDLVGATVRVGGVGWVAWGGWRGVSEPNPGPCSPVPQPTLRRVRITVRAGVRGGTARARSAPANLH